MGVDGPAGWRVVRHQGYALETIWAQRGRGVVEGLGHRLYFQDVDVEGPLLRQSDTVSPMERGEVHLPGVKVENERPGDPEGRTEGPGNGEDLADYLGYRNPADSLAVPQGEGQVADVPNLVRRDPKGHLRDDHLEPTVTKGGLRDEHRLLPIEGPAVETPSHHRHPDFHQGLRGVRGSQHVVDVHRCAKPKSRKSRCQRKHRIKEHLWGPVEAKESCIELVHHTFLLDADKSPEPRKKGCLMIRLAKVAGPDHVRGHDSGHNFLQRVES